MARLIVKMCLVAGCLVLGGFSAVSAYSMINERKAYLGLPFLSDTGFAIANRNAGIFSAASFAKDSPDVPDIELSAFQLKQLETQTRVSIQKEPLNKKGLRALAIAALIDGREDESLSLLQLSEKVSRRDSGTNLMLSRAYAKRGELEPALRTIDHAMRVSVSARQATLSQIMIMLSDDEAKRPILELLENQVPWERDFWAASASQPAALENLADMRIARERSGYEGEVLYDKRLLDALTQSRKFDAAKRLSNIYRGVEANSDQQVVNSDFSKSPEFLPFDWKLNFNNSMTTDVFASHGVLKIQTFGAGNGVAAKQLVSLGAKGATLLVQGKDWEERDSESAYVRISCATRPAAKINVDIDSETIQKSFQRPMANCRYNWLEIIVRPQADRRDNEITLDSVSIIPK